MANKYTVRLLNITDGEQTIEATEATVDEHWVRFYGPSFSNAPPDLVAAFRTGEVHWVRKAGDS